MRECEREKERERQRKREPHWKYALKYNSTILEIWFKMSRYDNGNMVYNIKIPHWKYDLKLHSITLEI